MNTIRNIYAVLVLVALCLASCEMKNELEGKYNLKNDEGLLTLELMNKTQTTPVTKAEGVALEDELDVNTYKVEIIDKTTEAVVRSFKSYADLKEALPLVVPTGEYMIAARSGEKQEASRVPYYEGASAIKVQQGMEARAEVVCKSAMVKVSLNVSEEFLKMFADDYVFTISNGKGGVLYVSKKDLGAVYLSVHDGATSIQIMAKVKEAETGRDIQTVYTVSKPGAETLQGGDSFNVTVKPIEEGVDPDDPDVTPSDPKLGIQLAIDLTMDEDGITVSIPTECIDESTPDPTPAPTPDPTPVGGPEIIGVKTFELSLSDPNATVQVTMSAPAGIKNLYVLIQPGNAGFEEAITMAGLKDQFDLANLGDLKDVVEQPMENGGIGLLAPGTVIKDEKEFIFDISSFIPLLALFEEGTHIFKMQLVDNNGNATKEADLTIAFK